MPSDDSRFPPTRAAPPPVPDDAVKTDPDSPFAAAPPPMTKGKFVAPPPEIRQSSFAAQVPAYAKAPIATGPPRVLGIVCLGWLAFTFASLGLWIPEEIVVPGCPGIAGIVTLVLAVYAWSGRNWARMFAMINAAAWGIGAVILAQTPAYEHLQPGAKVFTIVRAAFEIFAGYALNRPETVAFFELRKGSIAKKW
jgi:hypothetical protein